jgi:D-glycero-alpha-D-manno-heptose 1-phosphate guanylyltransferase
VREAVRKVTLAEIETYVLCGGRGERLRPAVSDRPKPLAEVAGRPFLAWVLEALRAQGLRRFTLCAGHRADAIAAYVAAMPADARPRLSIEPSPLGTGGALIRALGGDAACAIALNGDTLAVMDVADLVAAHVRFGAPLTIAVAPVAAQDSGACGRVWVDASGRVASFSSRPCVAATEHVSAGVYCFDTEALRAVAPRDVCSLERDVLPRLTGAARAFTGVRRFLDIGTPERYRSAEAWLRANGDFVSAPAAPPHARGCVPLS